MMMVMMMMVVVMVMMMVMKFDDDDDDDDDDNAAAAAADDDDDDDDDDGDGHNDKLSICSNILRWVTRSETLWKVGNNFSRSYTLASRHVPFVIMSL